MNSREMNEGLSISHSIVRQDGSGLLLEMYALSIGPNDSMDQKKKIKSNFFIVKVVKFPFNSSIQTRTRIVREISNAN